VRRGRDLNAERYLAWRGRAGQRPVDPGLTRGERQRLAVAAALAVVAVFCVVGFFSYA
jgi:energy-coupling factor transporter ATP-binding protein EcfA2